MDSGSNILRMNEAVYTWSDSVAEVDSNSESAGRFKPTNQQTRGRTSKMWVEWATIMVLF